MPETIIAAMKEIIGHYQFQVLDLYPRDLDHDRVVLDKCAVDGATIAWVVGNTHTHLAVLGLEPEQNEMVTCYTNLSASDKYYLIRVSEGVATFTEKSLSEFAMLASLPIPYSSTGGISQFTLRKHGERLVNCEVSRAGTYEKPLYQVTITTTKALTSLDRAAVEYWCHRAVAVGSGSLFSRRELNWKTNPALTQTQSFARVA
jgi:hypothetical protein